MTKLYVRFMNFMHAQKGQGMVEYGLIIALIAIVVIVALVAVSGSLKDIFAKTSSAISSVAATSN